MRRRVLGSRFLALCVSVTAVWLTLAQAPAVFHAQEAASASDLAARIQARYASVRDFTANFTQRQTSQLMPKPVEERGTVKIKKPGRMHWTYTTGDRNQTISDGTTIYFYFPRDRFVERRPLPREDEASTALLFLAGRGNLTRDFTASLPSDQPSGEWRLVLRPRGAQADFSALTLEVDRASLALRGMAIADEQGGTSAFRFTNMRENQGLADREFDFIVPRGVEIR